MYKMAGEITASVMHAGPITDAAQNVKVMLNGPPPQPQGRLWQSVSAASPEGYAMEKDVWLDSRKARPGLTKTRTIDGLRGVMTEAESEGLPAMSRPGTLQADE